MTEHSGTTCDDCIHLAGIITNYRSEVAFQRAKFENAQAKREAVRDALRAVENDDTNSSALWRNLHEAVFN